MHRDPHQSYGLCWHGTEMRNVIAKISLSFGEFRSVGRGRSIPLDPIEFWINLIGYFHHVLFSMSCFYFSHFLSIFFFLFTSFWKIEQNFDSTFLKIASNSELATDYVYCFPSSLWNWTGENKIENCGQIIRIEIWTSQIKDTLKMHLWSYLQKKYKQRFPEIKLNSN